MKLQALLQQVVMPLAQKGLTAEQPSVDVHATTVVDWVCVVVTVAAAACDEQPLAPLHAPGEVTLLGFPESLLCALNATEAMAKPETTSTKDLSAMDFFMENSYSLNCMDTMRFRAW
jgi:hypothetical protein